MSKYDALLVSPEIHKREITLSDGSKHELHFRELSAATYRKFQIRDASENPDERAGAPAFLVSESLCEPNGMPALTYEQALQLKPNPMNKLFLEVIALNGGGERKNASESAENSGSGTSSLSPSVAEPSPSGAKP